VRGAIESAQDYTASDLFLAQYRLRELKQTADELLASVDAILTPTFSIGFTISEMESDPLKLNSNLGKFTNFMNLLDYSAVAVPSGFT
ncbi:allophanate hydrolase, partial [Micrococcus sp. SIMBA_131]